MLVLSRRRDEEIVIQLPDGTEIVLTVVDMWGRNVRLGFEAPREIRVYRREVIEAIRAEERAEGVP